MSTPRGERPVLSVADAPERRRYEARTSEGVLAGRLDYGREGAVMTLRHTVVPQEFEGRGVAGALVAATLADLRARDLRVVARCPYVVSWLRRHAEWQDVLAEPLPPQDSA